MTLTLLFWILMLLWVGWDASTPWPARFPNILLFIIILTLGWAVFGAPIK